MIKEYKQATDTVMMIRPAKFGFNTQTAESNVFQQREFANNQEEIHKKALTEFDCVVSKLKERGIEVIVFEDTSTPHTPDAIFPNNWISFHLDKFIVIYPMEAINRRDEKRNDIVRNLKERFQVKQVLDLSYFENEKCYLEGTGSIVFDYINKKAYASKSSRTDESILTKLCKKINFQPIIFSASDLQGKAIYHTNVLMSIAEKYAVICTECIRNIKERESIKEHLKKSGREIIDISLKQVNVFAGNMLQLTSTKGEKLLLISKNAFHSLSDFQLNKLMGYNEILTLDVSTIEKYGGGSIRCMIASIH